MLRESVEAENDLANISQKTSYIKDWNQMRQLNQNRIKNEQETIPEESGEDFHHHFEHKRQRQIMKEASEKYDLKKCEKKLEVINQVDLFINKDLFKLEGKFTLPKCVKHQDKQPSSSSPLKRKQTSIEAEFIQKKLDLFQRKHVESQKKLHVRVLNPKSKYIPRSLKAKQNQKPQNTKKGKIIVNEEDIADLKRIISMKSKYNSVPQLIYQLQGLPLIRAFAR